MNQINLKNRLDASNGTTKNEPNNAMRPASQTKKTPWFLRFAPGAILRQSGLAVLAVGVDAAASFLKSKMEKAAAVASQVGAAVLQSKKAISSAAASILGDIQPKPQKIAVNRLASIPLFALLAVFFLAQPQAMAVPRGVWLPEYEEKQKYRNVTQFALQTYLWDTERVFKSGYDTPGVSQIMGSSVEEIYQVGRNAGITPSTTTTYFTKKGNKITTYRHVNNAGRTVTQYIRGKSALHLDLVFHTKVGEMETMTTLGQQTTRFGSVRQQEKLTKTWENEVYFYETQRMSGGPFHFRVHFGARNDFIPSDDLNCTGYCEAGRISAYPGPSTLISPCVPSNMSMPRNGYLEFHHWTQYVPDPDDDDE